jgi:uncharacterized protein (TIGR02271 family)
VPVRREEIRIEREPIADDDAGHATDTHAGPVTDAPDIAGEEHEMVLHEEEVVIEKRTVPKERVRISKETVLGEQTVSGDVRREEIETDTGERRL